MWGYVLKDFKLIIAVGPKAGSSSVRQILFHLNSVRESKVFISRIKDYNLDQLKDFTVILVWREPIQRLVSSFFMSEIKIDVTFEQFINDYDNLAGYHQKPQSQDRGSEMIKQLKIHHVVRTEDVGSMLLPLMEKYAKEVSTLTWIRNLHLNEREPSESTEIVEPWTVTKEDLVKNGLPKWSQMLSPSLMEKVVEIVKPDVDFYNNHVLPCNPEFNIP